MCATHARCRAAVPARTVIHALDSATLSPLHSCTTPHELSASKCVNAQASRANANAAAAATTAAQASSPATGDATVTLSDGTPAVRVPVKPTGTSRRTVAQARACRRRRALRLAAPRRCA